MIESVPDEMVDTFAIAGNKEFVKEAIDRYRGLADEIKLTPPTHYVTEEQTRFAQESILELVKDGEAIKTHELIINNSFAEIVLIDQMNLTQLMKTFLQKCLRL